MIFLLTQYFIHCVAESGLPVAIIPIKNGTCVSWEKVKAIRNKYLPFALNMFFVMRNVFKSLVISRQLHMVFLQFNGGMSNGITDNYNDFILIWYQKNNDCKC